jgi:thiamine-monophosphate kinase
MARSGEFSVIRNIFAPLAVRAPGALALRDDAALLPALTGREWAVTKDALVEGVHFLKNDPADLIARKSLRVNLSDLAAKGAKPEFYLLALSLPAWIDDAWIQTFASCLAADQDIFGVALIGGDTTATPGPLTLSITALGTVAEGKMIRRDGAREGDIVFVTGSVGEAGAGLALLKGEGRAVPERDVLIARYRLPEPRVVLGARLVGLAHACADVSDGLIADLGHIADASGVRMEIDAARVPVSPAVKAFWGADAIVRAATSGDDYELAFTAPQSARAGRDSAAREAGVALSEIGRVTSGSGIVLLAEGSQPIPLASWGFRHF